MQYGSGLLYAGKLVRALVAARLLAIPDPAAPVDLLLTPVCAVLMQHGKPVDFYSRKMTDPERKLGEP